MAKPILVIKVPENSINKDSLTKIHEAVTNLIDNEYHVLINTSHLYKTIKFECLNDCKGLPDVDIKGLIESYHNG